MAEDLPESNYSYPGRLVFNGLFSTNEVDRSPEQVIEGLEDYGPEEPPKTESGFKRSLFDQELARAGDVTFDLQRLADQISSVEYKQTKWKEVVKPGPNGPSPHYDDTRKHVGVHWDTKRNLIAFKSRKDIAKQKQATIRRDLPNEMGLDPITFDRDFFLWIVYQVEMGRGISPELSVRQLERAETDSENPGNFGDIVLKETEDMTSSLPVVGSILKDKPIEALEATFVVGENHQVMAEVQNSGRIEVKVSETELGGFDDLRRMSAGLQFVFELVDRHQKWKALPNSRKYPPDQFFKVLLENIEEQGWDIDTKGKKVRQKYRRKRQGNPIENQTLDEAVGDAQN